MWHRLNQWIMQASLLQFKIRLLDEKFLSLYLRMKLLNYLLILLLKQTDIEEKLNEEEKNRLQCQRDNDENDKLQEQAREQEDLALFQPDMEFNDLEEMKVKIENKSQSVLFKFYKEEQRD